MFKNVMVYRIGAAWNAVLEAAEESLGRMAFAPCGATQERSIGWVPPRGQAHGALVEAVAGHWLLRLMVESKAVPANVVKRKAEEQAAEIEARTGRKPGRKEIKELREDALHALLPQAFTKQARVLVWIDPKERWLVVDAGSASRADEVVTFLIASIDGFMVEGLQTATSASAAMAHWLTSGEAPEHFSIDRECELKATDESRSVVRYARHPLDIEEVRQHIEQGKQPTRLALSWEDRVSFLLTETLQIKKIAFQDAVFEGSPSDRPDDDFDADAAIATGELGRLLPDLIAALGGELELGVAAAVPPAAAASAGAAGPKELDEEGPPF